MNDYATLEVLSFRQTDRLKEKQIGKMLDFIGNLFDCELLVKMNTNQPNIINAVENSCEIVLGHD